MYRWLLFVVLAAACRLIAPSVVPSAPTSAVIHLDGDTNPRSMPPSCRAHGGTPPVASAPPRWTAGTRRDRRLDSLGVGQLTVHVTSARTEKPFDLALVSLEGSSSPAARAGTVADGWAQLEAPAGRYVLQVRAFALVRARLDAVSIRRGYTDTVVLVVGQPWKCGI